MRKTVYLGKVDYDRSGQRNCKVTLEIEVTRKQPTTAPYLDTDLNPIQGEVVELSICGSVWNPREADIYSGGQNIGTIREFFGRNPKVRRICEIWDRYHLNGMNAGTRAQSEALKDCTYISGADHYKQTCAFLESRDLYSVPIPEGSRVNFGYLKTKDGELPTEYRYGQAWLYESVPADVLAEVESFIAEFVA